MNSRFLHKMYTGPGLPGYDLLADFHCTVLQVDLSIMVKRLAMVGNPGRQAAFVTCPPY